MKNLKKFVALLLAGVMAMVMLTACSGGTVTDEQKQELAYKRISGRKQVNSASVTENDRELQGVAEKYLKQDLKGSVDFLGAKWVAGFHVDGKKEEYLTITATSSYKAGYLVTTMLDHLQDWVGGKELPDTNVNLNAKGSWTKLGVVVKTDPDTKQSYMAISFKIANPNYVK